MKFGGTSVGSAERMQVSARLAAEERRKRPVAIVVSAMSKVTDLLLDTMRHAEKGNQPAIDSAIAALRSRHAVRRVRSGLLQRRPFRVDSVTAEPYCE